MRAKIYPQEEIKSDMVAMIDVTFLLLIFFMCTLNFRPLEGKIKNYLPKNGRCYAPVEKKPDLVVIKLLYTPKGTIIAFKNHDAIFKEKDKYSRLYKLLLRATLNMPGSFIAIEPDIEISYQDIVTVLNIFHRVNKKRSGSLKLKFIAKAIDEK